jgi:hypothetical protein
MDVPMAHPIDSLTIERYEDSRTGYAGYIAPKDLSWTIWFGLDGAPALYCCKRNPDGHWDDANMIDLRKAINSLDSMWTGDPD